MGEEDLFAGDGKFPLAEFLVAKQFGQIHSGRLKANCGGLKFKIHGEKQNTRTRAGPRAEMGNEK
jgi:hypothetical protein